METFTRKHIIRLRQKQSQNNPINAQIITMDGNKESETTITPEVCSILCEGILKKNQHIMTVKRKKRKMPIIRVPESIANSAALSLYRSMILKPEKTNEKVQPTRSIKYYTSEKWRN